MTQSTFKDGQTLWWLWADTVTEVTFSHYVPADSWTFSPPGWFVKPANEGSLAVLFRDLYTTREAAYEKGIKRLADKGSRAWKDYMAINDRLDKLNADYREGGR
jgi:hypothetical protein